MFDHSLNDCNYHTLTKIASLIEMSPQATQHHLSIMLENGIIELNRYKEYALSDEFLVAVEKLTEFFYDLKIPTPEFLLESTSFIYHGISNGLLKGSKELLSDINKG